MSSMRNFVSSYNGRKAELQAKYRRAIQAKKTYLTRKAEIDELVAEMFWRVRPGIRRSLKDMNKAYETAEYLARIGGEDYQAAVTVLKFATTVRNPETYAEACAVCLLEVNG